MWYEMPEGEQTLDELQARHRAGSDEWRTVRRELARADRADADGRAARRTDRATHRAHAAGRLHFHRRSARSGAAVECRRADRRGAAGQIRNHRQEPRFSWIQVAAQSAGLARQIELWTARYARSRYRHRSQRVVQDLRVRRHAESRHHGDALQRDPARRAHSAAEHRILATCRCISANTSPRAPPC